MSEVILKDEGGFVSIVVPTGDCDVDNYKDRENYNVIEQASLPTNRVFRDAWTINGTIDITRAKDIWKNKVRVARNKRLQELDIEWMKAMEQGEISKATAIANQKKTLRDITDREEITNASSVQELESFWPDILER